MKGGSKQIDLLPLESKCFVGSHYGNLRAGVKHRGGLREVVQKSQNITFGLMAKQK
jgi:hypothetical protein